MKVTIEIPDNCEIVKDGERYIVKEKKQIPPRTWKEFCSMNRVKSGEAWIEPNSGTACYDTDYIRDRRSELDRNLCTSKEEAEAFLALMQLRQLRKAWVGDWEPNKDPSYGAVYNDITMGVIAESFSIWNPALTFPTEDMAKDFLECFRDLCETAKILL